MASLCPNSDGRPEPESRKLNEPSKTGKHVHTEKFHRCWQKVSAKKGSKSAFAICTASLGAEGLLKK